MIILWNERMYSIENFLYAYYSWMFTVNVTDEENDGKYADTTTSLLNQLHQGALALEPLQDMKSQTIGNLPDDEDELLAGIMDDFNLSGLPTQVEDLEECDIFSSGGGMELDFDSQEGLNGNIHRSILDNLAGNGNVTYGISNGLGTVPGEHPYGEHPSRTLFVRNINSNVEESELHELFEVMMCRCLFSILHGYLLGYLSFFQGIFSIMVSL